MINNVRKLASTDHETRKAALIKILKETGVAYRTQSEVVNDRFVENFIVRFGGDQKRIVVGAHYDSVEGSTGANDNATGVCVLLALIQRFSKKPPDISADIVIFDYEENMGLGSKLYVREYGNDVLAMINADICGVGDTVLIAPRKNLSKGILADAVKNLNREALGFRVLDKLPTGDEWIFEENNIDNISVCIVEEKDAEPMAMLFSGKKEITKEDFPSIIETMHNGCRDTVEVVEEAAMERVLKFIYELMMSIQIPS